MTLKQSYKGVKKTFLVPKYLIVCFITLFIILTGLSLYDNIELLQLVLTSTTLPVIDRFMIILNQYPVINTVTPIVDDIGQVLIAIGIGVNIALLYNQYDSGRIQFRNSATTSIGTSLAIFGAGCASCGAALLGSVLSLIGGTSLFVLLPYGGKEILWISIVLLVGSAYVNSRELGKPISCDITN